MFGLASYVKLFRRQYYLLLEHAHTSHHPAEASKNLCGIEYKFVPCRARILRFLEGFLRRAFCLLRRWLAEVIQVLKRAHKVRVSRLVRQNGPDCCCVGCF